MEYVKYDFSSLCSEIRNTPKYKTEKNIKRELNDFFSGQCNCEEVIFTQNDDKEMFGIMITPLSFSSNQILFDERQTIYSYRLEIDSKLYNAILMNISSEFDPCEVILSMILHDINKITSQKCLDNVYDIIDNLVANTDSTLKIEELVTHPKMFEFVTSYTLRTSTSIMCKDPDEIITDDFIQGYGLIDQLNEGSRCINRYRSFPNINYYPNTHYLVAQWYIDVIHNADADDYYVKSLIKKMYDMTPSKLIKDQLNNAMKEITPEDKLQESANSYMIESNIKAIKNKTSLFSQIKRNGLRSIEEDLYEYSVRVKNVETEEDAILLMRQLNSRLEILDDYLTTEQLPESDKKRWSSLLDKYMKLREQLSKKAIYKQKMYGLFVDYNALQNLPSSNGVMNTYY